jgi:hypothetical protein
MAERKQQTKAERRQAAASGQPAKADRKQEDGGQQTQTKADRKQARIRRKQRAGSADAVEPIAGANGSSDDGIELRLARLEQAVATQSELSEQLLGKLDEVLHEARKSARHAKTAVTRPDPAEAAEAEEEPAEDS